MTQRSVSAARGGTRGARAVTRARRSGLVRFSIPRSSGGQGAGAKTEASGSRARGTGRGAKGSRKSTGGPETLWGLGASGSLWGLGVQGVYGVHGVQGVCGVLGARGVAKGGARDGSLGPRGGARGYRDGAKGGPRAEPGSGGLRGGTRVCESRGWSLNLVKRGGGVRPSKVFTSRSIARPLPLGCTLVADGRRGGRARVLWLCNGCASRVVACCHAS